MIPIFIIAVVIASAVAWWVQTMLEAMSRGFAYIEIPGAWPHTDIILTALAIAVAVGLAAVGTVELGRQLIEVLL
jgi:hypothetical protein